MAGFTSAARGRTRDVHDILLNECGPNEPVSCIELTGEGHEVVMATQCVAAVPERELRFGVGSLVEHAIFRYLMQNDFVLSGAHVTKEMYETI